MVSVEDEVARVVSIFEVGADVAVLGKCNDGAIDPFIKIVCFVRNFMRQLGWEFEGFQ